MTQEKNLSKILKLHKNSKTYLDAQNEFAPKLKLSWVVSDPTQTWPAHCSGQAVTGETPFSTEGPLVQKFLRLGIGIRWTNKFWGFFWWFCFCQSLKTYFYTKRTRIMRNEKKKMPWV